MIKVKELSEEENRLISEIASINLQSLYRLHTKGASEEVEDLLKNYENVNIEDYENTKNDRIRKFHDLQDNPYKITEISNDDLTIFRHILSEIEKEYKHVFPHAIESLWKKLFFMEEFRFNVQDDKQPKLN